MSNLLPPGIDHLGDAPFNLHAAITQALRILDYEEFEPSERPPRHIWLNSERLTEWWARVEAERKKKYGTSTTSEEDLDDDDPAVSHNAVELVKRG